MLITGGVVAATAATAGLLLAGCSTSTEGVRKEGPAQTRSTAESAGGKAPTASPSASRTKVDAAALIKGDPRISDAVKKNFKPCVKDQYPVDVIYGQLTGASRDDVVVNILTCGDAIGIGSYVYRAKGDSYENVFSSETSPVYADIDRGDLQVTTQIYGSGDPVADPSGEDVVTYHWTDGRFRETGRTHTDFSKVGGTTAKSEGSG
ncbi:lipoprotein [Streptomyces caatingaensis]|uniref:Lipoprotein n=1 Tax=Streptomyces caatingaensis TaxID=1678637 RepID=A0A0K9XHH0_9ACTN|nr:lipoprotein [Streptomyces caatingaensis]